MGNLAATVQQIAEWVGGRVEGDGAVEIRGIASLETAEAGELTFATDAKHLAHLSDSRASAVIVATEAAVSASLPLIRVQDVQAAVATVLGHWAPPPDHPPSGVHPSAVVADDAQVADTAHARSGRDDRAAGPDRRRQHSEGGCRRRQRGGRRARLPAG